MRFKRLGVQGLTWEALVSGRSEGRKDERGDRARAQRQPCQPS